MTAAPGAQRTIAGTPAGAAPSIRESLSTLTLADLALVVAPRWRVKASTTDAKKLAETIAQQMLDPLAATQAIARMPLGAQALLACVVARGGTVHQELAARAFGDPRGGFQETVNELHQSQLLLAVPQARSEPPQLVVPRDLLPTLNAAFRLDPAGGAVPVPVGKAHMAQVADPFVALAQLLARVAAMGGLRTTKDNAVHRVDVRKLTEWRAGRAVSDLTDEEASIEEERIADIVNRAAAIGLLKMRDLVLVPDPARTATFFSFDRQILLEILAGSQIILHRHTGERRSLLALARSLPDLDPHASYRVRDLRRFILAHRVMEGLWPLDLTPATPFRMILESLARLGILTLEGQGDEAILTPTDDFQRLRGIAAYERSTTGGRVLVVNPNYEVIILDPQRVTPHLHTLLHACETTTPDSPIFKLTRASIERATKNGIAAASIVRALEQASDAPVPQSVAYSIANWSKPSASPSFALQASLVVRGAGAAELAHAKPDLFEALGPDAVIVRNDPPAAVAELVRRGHLPKGYRLTNYDVIAQTTGTKWPRPTMRELDATTVPLGALGLPARRSTEADPGGDIDYAQLREQVVEAAAPRRKPPPDRRFQPIKAAMPTFPASIDARSIHNLARALGEERPVQVTARDPYGFIGDRTITRRGLPIEIRSTAFGALLVLAEGKRLHEVPLRDIREIRVA